MGLLVSIEYIAGRRSYTPLVAIVVLMLLHQSTYLLAQQQIISSYQDIDQIYEVTIYDDYDFTVFLSDVDTMINHGEFFGVKVSRGMIEEIVVIRQNSDIYKVFVEEVFNPAIDSKGIVYEFAGYYVRKRVGSSFVQTILLQKFGGFLVTACLGTNFTLTLRLRNSSRVFEYSTTSIKASILDFKAFTIAFLVEVNATDIAVSEVDNGIFIKYTSRYPCLSIAGIARFGIEDLVLLLNNVSMADIYRYVDSSREMYHRYTSALPGLKSGVKVIQDLYYVSLYNRLNTLLYPELFGGTDLGKTANYVMSVRILKLSGRELYKTLDSMFARLNLSNPHDAFVGLEIAEFLNDKEKLDTICRNAKRLKAPNNLVEVAILSKVLSSCNAGDNKEIATALFSDLTLNDILALSELGVVPSSLLQLIRVDKLFTPSSCWECLSYSQNIKLLEPSLVDIFLHLRDTNTRYTCVDYIVVAAFAGIDLDNNVVLFNPVIPAPNEVLHITVKIAEAEVNVVYNGWGSTIKSVRVNGLPVDMVAIPTDMLKSRVNTIEIEMTKKVIKLDVVIMNSGIPLKGVPVYIRIAQQGLNYNMVSITDSDGRAVFMVQPHSYLVISANISDLGLLQLRSWVGDKDSVIVIDIAEMFNKISYVTTSIRFLEERILNLEKNIEIIKSRYTSTQSSLPETQLKGVHDILSSIALFASSVALGIALINIRRRGA